MRLRSFLEQVRMSRQATQQTGEGFEATGETEMLSDMECAVVDNPANNSEGQTEKSEMDIHESERLLEETSKEFSEGKTKDSSSHLENEDSGSFLKIFCFKDAMGLLHCISCTFKIENNEGQDCSICGISIHTKCLNICRLPVQPPVQFICLLCRLQRPPSTSSEAKFVLPKFRKIGSGR